MHLTPYLSWTLAVLAFFPSTIVCASDDETSTKSDIKTESEKVTATTEESSIPTSSPTSSVQQDSNSTEATTTTSQRPVTTAIAITPETDVPNLLEKWSDGARGQQVELITALLGLAVAFVV